MPLWLEAVDFATEVYKFCEVGKLRTDYRMKDQIRAAVASISNNIAEGFEYQNNRIFIRFLLYAKGSSGELFNQFTILSKAGMIVQPTYEYFSNRSLRIGKKIGGFIQYLKKSANP
ncbi:four helix bundle protein [Sediminibacterium soli]|uniref:four helix bundle protein n=1 Tax=Sediminibacterium soli TaxID=2698829 RepID=UPI00137A670A|nr:four helix bundle protein [Sediminibacterium soli]NCI47676.1 four helix bundle protein [Sediminibacterium soli]